MSGLLFYEISSYIYRILTVLLLILGIFLNLISAIIYSKKKMRKTSYSSYLFALAVVDLCVSLVGNTRYIFMSFEISYFKDINFNVKNANIYRGFDIREHSIVVCRLHTFATYFFLQLSSLLLCLLSIDRYVGVALALKAFSINKKSIARKIIIITITVLFFLNVHILISMGYDTYISVDVTNTTGNNTIDKRNVTLLKNGTNKTTTTTTIVSFLNNSTRKSFTQPADDRKYVKKTICEINERHNTIYFKFWQFYFYIDTLIYCLVPFVVMFTSNIFTITRMIRSRVKSKAVLVAKKSTKHKPSTSSSSQQTATVNNSHKSSTRSQVAKASTSNSSISANEQRVLRLLISISFTFLVLTFPVFLVEFFDHFYRHMFYSEEQREFWFALSYLLMYTNHVVNFVFYFAFGPKFRKQVRKLMPKYFSKKSIKTLKYTSSNKIIPSNNGFHAQSSFCRRLCLANDAHNDYAADKTNDICNQQRDVITIPVVGTPNVYEIAPLNNSTLTIDQRQEINISTKDNANKLSVLFKRDSTVSFTIKRTHTTQTMLVNSTNSNQNDM